MKTDYRISKANPEGRCRTIMCVAALLVVPLYALWMSLECWWTMDSVYYAFIHGGEMPGNWSDTPVRNFHDFILSQSNHYLYQNGRAFCHVLVQLFCATRAKTLFAILNAIVWVFCIAGVARLSSSSTREALRQPRILWGSALLCLLAMMGAYDPAYTFDPAYQINYVWMTAINIWWIALFFSDRKGNIGSGILLLIFGIIAGQGHEALSLPISVGILCYFCVRRFKVVSRKWWMAIGYAIGAASVGLAPGTFNRVGNSTEGVPMFSNTSTPIVALIPVLILIIAVIARRRSGISQNIALNQSKNQNKTQQIPMYFLLSAALTSYIFFVSFAGRFGIRTVIAGMLLSGVAAMLLSGKKGLPTSGFILLIITILPAIVIQTPATLLNAQKHREIFRRYQQSANGLVYLPDRYYSYDARGTFAISDYMTREMHLTDPQKPPLTVLPEGLRRLPKNGDTNAVVSLGDGMFIIRQSESAPADFTIHRKLLPGLLDIPVGDRVIERVDSTLDIFIHDSGQGNTAFYSAYPAWLISGNVEVANPEIKRTH